MTALRIRNSRRFRPEVTPLEDRVVPSVTEINETESNNTPASADALPATDGLIVVNGTISVAGDVDYFKFTVAANQRLWAYVETGGTTGPSQDAVLTLFDTNGTTQIELDDDDGTALALDGSVVTGLAPVIAGRRFSLAGGGTHYLKVQEYNDDSVLSPYRLYLRLTDHPTLSLLTNETEPNDTRLSADTISATEAAPLRTAAIGNSSDVDVYSFYARAGDRVFIAADGDPDRNGVGPDLQLQLVRGLLIPDVLATVNSSPTSTAADPAAEGFSYLIPDSGTYYVSVSGLSGTTGSYDLLVTGNSHPGTLQFGTAASTGSEGGVVAVTVLRTGGADGMVAVNYAVSGGSAGRGGDYTLADGTLTFADGQTSKSILIPVHGDSHVEGTETIALTLSQPTNGAQLGSRTTTTVFLRDSTVPPAPLPVIAATAIRRKGKSRVLVFDALTGAMRGVLTPFRGHAGRLRLELRDVNGDGSADLIVREGGRGKKKRVYDALTLAPLPTSLA